MGDKSWTWSQIAPDGWFVDRSRACMLVRGYLTVESEPSSPSKQTPSSALADSDVLVTVVRGELEIPQPITVHYVGEGKLARSGGGESARLPSGTYLLLVARINEPLRELKLESEREAQARVDSAAGLVGAVLGHQAVYQEAFEFLCAADGPGVHVSGPSMRAISGRFVIDDAALDAVRAMRSAVMCAPERKRARAQTALRWYAQALAERDRTDAFVKHWIALEALCFSGSSKTKPLLALLAKHYGRDEDWVSNTLGVNDLAQVRGQIMHNGRRPMPHGKLMTFLEALFVDALHASLGLPNEGRAEAALPGGEPLRVSRWSNTGSIATISVTADR